MKLSYLRDSLIFTALILLYGLVLYQFLRHYVNFPENLLGRDAVPHAAKVVILNKWGLEGFRWLPNYYFGNPHFTFYTPSTYILPLLIQHFFNLSEEDLIKVFNWIGYFSILSSLLFIMLLIYLKSGSRLMSAFFGGVFFGTSPGIFEPWLFGGNYPELFALPSIPLSLIFLDRFLKTSKLKYLLLFMIVGVYAITGHQAVGLFYIVFSLCWILGSNIPRKQKIINMITLPSILFCLVAWYVIPLAYIELTHKVRESLWMEMPSAFKLWDYLVTFFNVEMPSLPSDYRFPGFNLAILIPAILCIIAGLRKKARREMLLHEAITMFSIGLGILIYFILCVSFLLPFPAGFHPSRFIPYILISFSVSVGLLMNYAPSLSLRALAFIFIFLGLIFFSLFPPYYNIIVDDLLTAGERHSLQEIRSLITDHNMYRIGGVRDELFYWIHLYHPDLYTSRGYYALGILYIDWQALFEHALAGAPPTPYWNNSILHLLDWSGLRYVGLMEGDSATILLSNSILKPLTNFLNFTIYEFSYSPPISEVVYDGGILVFGDYEGYDVILRSIAMSNYVKPVPIIVWAGGECIDDISPDILGKFSSIILYRYCYKDRGKAFNILAEYVSKGGRLFIETASSIDECSEMPQPIPVSKICRKSVQNDWSFNILEDPLTANITKDVFSPPIYDGGPWGVSSSSVNDLRSEAKPLLASDSEVLVAYIRYGNGVVVWSGLNLPYHALAYQNIDEADFMKRFVMYNVTTKTEHVQMIRNSATSVTFKVPPKAKGIIFRERYISNLVFSWKASDSRGELKFFIMGPGFNYIVIRDELEKVEDVNFVLHDAPIRIGSILLSAFTTFLLVVVLIRKHYTKRSKGVSVLTSLRSRTLNP